jgi:hypothetical protein
MMKMIDPIYSDTTEQPLIRQLQLHPSLYCLMATDEQAALMINVIADAIEYEGLSGTTVDWLRTQTGRHSMTDKRKFCIQHLILSMVHKT